jgi:virginiamycin B lyase
MTPPGTVTEFPLPLGSAPDAITTGPDGNLWFTDTGTKSVGRMTPAGAVTEFVVTDAYGKLGGITAGPDGNLWFVDAGKEEIGRITP